MRMEEAYSKLFHIDTATTVQSTVHLNMALFEDMKSPEVDYVDNHFTSASFLFIIQPVRAAHDLHRTFTNNAGLSGFAMSFILLDGWGSIFIIIFRRKENSEKRKEDFETVLTRNEFTELFAVATESLLTYDASSVEPFYDLF